MNKYEKERRLSQMIRLREQGWSFQAIADNLGLSRQRVYQLIGKRNIAYFKPITPKQCVFDGLRDWLNQKSMSIAELIRQVRGEHKYHPVVFSQYRAYLTGRHNMKMPTINAILRVTGLTYEQAFGNKGERK